MKWGIEDITSKVVKRSAKMGPHSRKRIKCCWVVVQVLPYQRNTCTNTSNITSTCQPENAFQVRTLFNLFSSPLPFRSSPSVIRHHKFMHMVIFVITPCYNNPCFFFRVRSCSSVALASFENGLVHLSVPLPSRDENCRFTIKPISSTVGDFLEALKVQFFRFMLIYL